MVFICSTCLFLLYFLFMKTTAKCTLPDFKGEYSLIGFNETNVINDTSCALLQCENPSYYNSQFHLDLPIQNELFLSGKYIGNDRAVIYCFGEISMFCVLNNSTCHNFSFSNSNCFINPSSVVCETRFSNFSTASTILLLGTYIIFFFGHFEVKHFFL